MIIVTRRCNGKSLRVLVGSKTTSHAKEELQRFLLGSKWVNNSPINTICLMSATSKSVKDIGLKILDGGMGNFLQRTGVPFNGSLWSLTALLESQYHPNVISAHQSFLKAGCNIITTNTYSVTPLYLSNIDKDHELESLYKLSVDLARTAKHQYLSEYIDALPAHQQNNNLLIAAGIPPLMESYRADQVLAEPQSIYYYNRIMNALKNMEFDIYIIETMSCLKEAKYVLNAMICNNNIDKKDIYLFFALREDGLLRDGEDFNDAMIKLEEYLDILQIKYIGFNCCKPESFDIIMNNLNDNTLQILSNNNILIGCYPNGLADIPTDCVLQNDGAKQIRNDLSSQALYCYFKEWIKKYNNHRNRFALLGGCCAVDPYHLEYAVNHIQKDFPSLLTKK